MRRLLAACAGKSHLNIGFSACLVFISLRLVNSLVDTSQVGLELVNRLPSILKINRVLPVEHRPGGPARNLPNDTPKNLLPSVNQHSRHRIIGTASTQAKAESSDRAARLSGLFAGLVVTLSFFHFFGGLAFFLDKLNKLR